MPKHLYILCCGCLLAVLPACQQPAPSAQVAPQFAASFRPMWQRASEYTLETAQLMPEEFYNYKPEGDMRTFGEQLVHTAQNLYWLTSTYITESPNPLDTREQERSKTEVIQLLHGALAYVDSALATTSEAALRDTVSLFNSIPVPRDRVFLLMRDHMTHHRAQAIVYLRLKGIEPPKYRGW